MYRRLIQSLLALLGTAWYAYSFVAVAPREVALMAAAAGVASGVSWLVLGGVLVVCARRAGAAYWFDACLITMTRGMAFLIAGALMNTFSPVWNWSDVHGVLLHLLLLLAAAGVMTSTFVDQGQRAGFHPLAGLALWAGGLMFPFITLLFVYYVRRFL